jgi:hypothetical protein
MRSKSRRKTWMGKACSMMEEKRKAYEILAGEPRRPWHRCKATNTMCIKGTILKYVDFIHLARDKEQWHAVVNKIMLGISSHVEYIVAS